MDYLLVHLVPHNSFMVQEWVMALDKGVSNFNHGLHAMNTT